jgi:Mg-chelatase subunit ChlI
MIKFNDIDAAINQVMEGVNPLEAIIEGEEGLILSKEVARESLEKLKDARIIIKSVESALDSYAEAHDLTEDFTVTVDSISTINDTITRLERSLQKFSGITEQDDEEDPDMDEMDDEDDEMESKMKSKKKKEQDDKKDDSKDDKKDDSKDDKEEQDDEDDPEKKDDKEEGDDEPGDSKEPSAVTLRIKGIPDDKLDEFKSELEDLIGKYDAVSDDEKSEELNRIIAMGPMTAGMRTLMTARSK